MTASSAHPIAAPGKLGAGIWRLADPKISLASMASMLLGACIAATQGALAPGWLALTVLGIFCLEVAKNASGEVFDYDSGTDLTIRPENRSPFSGGKRVMVDGLLSRRQTWVVAAVSYALGIVIGLAIVAWREPAVLPLGVVGVALAFTYHAPPLKLSYRGAGELAVGLAYGPLIAAGTVIVQHGTVPRWAVLAALPLGLLIAAFLWVNEFPDHDSDRAAHKLTLVVRLGRPAAATGFAIIVAVALLATALLPLAGAPRGVLLGLVAGVPAIQAARTLLAHPTETPLVIPAQAKTLLSFLTYAVAAGVGMLVWR